MTSMRGSVISSMAERMPSRPRPESLTPPNGMGSRRQLGVSPDDEPTHLQFAICGQNAARIAGQQTCLQAIASSDSPRPAPAQSRRRAQCRSQGQIVSSSRTFMPAFVPVRMTGVMTEPLPLPACHKLGAALHGLLTQASTRSASLRRTRGPTSVVSSEGSPRPSWRVCSTTFHRKV